MLLSTSFYRSITAIGSLLLFACGGGSSNDGNQIQLSSSYSSTQSIASSSTSSTQSSSQPLGQITRENAPIIVSTFLEWLNFARDTSIEIINDEYNFGIPDGRYSDSCENDTGTFDITVSNSGNSVTQTYNNCLFFENENGNQESYLVSGSENFTFLHTENMPSTFSITWNNYSIVKNWALEQTLSGSLSYEGLSFYSDDFIYENITSRIVINLSLTQDNLTISAENIELVYDFPSLFEYYDEEGKGLHLFSQNIKTITGKIYSSDHDAASINFLSEDLRISLNGSGDEQVHIDIKPKGYHLKWNQNGDDLLDASVFLSETEYINLSKHAREENSEISFTQFTVFNDTQFPHGHITAGNYENLSMSKGTTLDVNITELFTNKSGELLTYEINNQAISDDWEQLESGHFILKFPSADGTELFELDFTAIDADGNRSPAITARVQMDNALADTDNDGILDSQDDDIDNDGVGNWTDRFPFDATESIDTDSDGIGNNKDTDIDDDGVENLTDAYPMDINCNKIEHGDGDICYLTGSQLKFFDADNVAYFIQTIRNGHNVEKRRFVSFDLESNSFQVPSAIFENLDNIIHRAIYHPESHSAITESYDPEWIYKIELNNYGSTAIINKRGLQMYPLYTENGFIAIRVWRSSTESWTEIYDINGTLIDSNETELDATSEYYLSYAIQKTEAIPFCGYSISIDENGSLIETGDKLLFENDACYLLGSVSDNGQYFFSETFTGTPGIIYGLNKEPVMEVRSEQMLWLGNLVAYIDIDTGSLNTKNINNELLHTLSNPDRRFETIYTMNQKIIHVTKDEFNRPIRLEIYDQGLNILFDSRAH